MRPRPPGPDPRLLALTIDDHALRVPEGTTILAACRAQGIDVPTLCWAANLTPVNACRLCVVEVQGARTLVPSCSRKVEAGMVVRTGSDRVRRSRKVVLELLASSVDLAKAPELRARCREYGADPARFGAGAASLAQPAQVDNELFVRDYAACVLCYKCVEACGTDAQNTFAIAIAGRGFAAHVATEFEVPLPDSACVYCGNCVGVCPTGALVSKAEHDLREAQDWRPEDQTRTQTICPYCGVGCTLELTAQDGRIVKADSPVESEVTGGQLCVKGRFGWGYVAR